MKLLLLLLLTLGLVSCSGSKSTDEFDEADAGIELSDSDEFAEDVSEEDTIAENSDELNLEETSDDMTTADSGETPIITEAGGIEEYTVQKNETLMMISFKVYGDYSMWRKISALNGGVKNLKEGMTIKYEKPVEMFSWAPEGNRYLIKTGDTLGGISTTSYGTMKFWKNIWTNNKPLIKDPNRIYAGFTIFTPVIERGVANNMEEEL